MLMSLIGASAENDDEENGRGDPPDRIPPDSAAPSDTFCSRSASAQSAMPSSSAGLSSIAMSLSFPVEVITPQTLINPNCIFCVMRPILAFKYRYTIHRHLNSWLAIQFNEIAHLHRQQLLNC